MFGVHQHEAARRLWMIALDVARDAEHPLGTDQTVFVLYDMALQAVELGRPDEALSLVHLGHAAASGTHPVSAATTSCLATIQARAHAAQGDTAACDRALGQSAEHFGRIDATHDSMADFLNEAHLALRQAVDAVTALHSPRAFDRLRVLNTALEPLHTSAGVAELRDRLTTTAVQHVVQLP